MLKGNVARKRLQPVIVWKNYYVLLFFDACKLENNDLENGDWEIKLWKQLALKKAQSVKWAANSMLKGL